MASILDILFSRVGFAAIVFLVAVSFPYVLLPIGLKLWMRVQAIPKFVVFDPQQHSPPADVWSFFQETTRILEPEGFRPAAYIIAPELIPNMRSILMVLENHTTMVAAMAVTMYGSMKTAQGTDVRMKNRHVEFSSEGVDGMHVDTNNSSEENAFAPVAEKKMLQLPEIPDAVRLYRIHLRSVQEFMVGAKRQLPPSDQWINELSNSTQKEMDGQTGTGYFFLDSRGEFYRLTWKGTFLMTWKQLWPVKSIRQAMRRRRNRRLLAEWGMVDHP